MGGHSGGGGKEGRGGAGQPGEIPAGAPQQPNENNQDYRVRMRNEMIASFKKSGPAFNFKGLSRKEQIIQGGKQERALSGYE